MKQGKAVLLVANYSNDTGYAWSNIYRLYNSIARKLQENSIQICLSFAEIRGQVGFIDKDIQIKSFVFDPYNISFSSLLALRRAIKKNNIRYIYFTDMKTWHWLYAVLRLWGIKKIIVHCRISVPSPFPARTETGLKKLIKSSLNSIALLRADYVYAISGFVRNRLINKDCYPAKRVIKILNGIDVDKYLCTDDAVEHDEVIIFCCGRANKHKGVATLIQAGRILKDKYKLKDYSIQYAGSGPDLDNFKLLAENLKIADKIVFLGQLASTHEHACNADIIVVPSEWGEGFGSTVAEGMAAGKAVVATRVGGIPEVIGDDEHGVLVPPGDSEAMAKALNTLIENDDGRQRLGSKARQRAQQYFNVTTYHNQVIQRMLHDFST